MKLRSPHQKSRQVFLALGLAVALAALPRCKCCSNKGSTATIGFLLPLGTETGSQARKGGELAIQHLNEEFRGEMSFEARWEDSRGKAGPTGTRMEALASDPSVMAVVGPIDSGPAIAAANVANRNHLLLVSPLASTPALAHANDFFYRTWPSDASEAKFTSTYVRETLGLTKLVVLHVGATYGQDLASAFSEDFRSHGGAVVDTVEYPPDTQSFDTIVTRVVNRSPQAVYFVGYPPDMAEVLREFRSRAVAFPIVSAAIVSDPSVAQLAGQNVEGVMFPFPATFDVDATNAVMDRFEVAYTSAYGEGPSFVAAQTYDATILLGRTVVRSRSGDELPSRQVMQDKLEETRRFDGATGSFEFDSNGDAVRQFRMYEIRDGRMTPKR